jgi:hypothetical protein
VFRFGVLLWLVIAVILLVAGNALARLIGAVILAAWLLTLGTTAIRRRS